MRARKLVLISIIFACILCSDSTAHPQRGDVASVSFYLQPTLIKDDDGSLKRIVEVKINSGTVKNSKIEIFNHSEKLLSDTIREENAFFKLKIPAVKRRTTIRLNVLVDEQLIKEKDLLLKPVKQREIHLIAHSHNDIGYSDLQINVEKQQNQHVLDAMDLIDRTSGYPEGAKFKWNIEALWAVENFMKVASDEEKSRFFKNIREGNIDLAAGYCNVLTGVMRPEELSHLFDYSLVMRQKTGIENKTYMITDVPGLNWSVVEEFSKKGIRYISSGPNYMTRIGDSKEVWGDKPFYWVSPSGKDSLLFWMAGKGYSFFLIHGRLEDKTSHYLFDYMDELDSRGYPYDMVQLRYTIGKDNSGPDPNLSDYVRDWNSKYESPKLIISTLDEMMTSFEHKYGEILPSYQGAFTPYWEDGVMSSAYYEALAKQGVERLIQAEKLQEIIPHMRIDSVKLYQAWRSALMWHEHTWGAHTSISHPDSSFTLAQWAYKKQFALDQDSLSKEIMNRWIKPDAKSAKGSYKVYNTSNWERNDIVYLSKEQSAAGDGIVDKKGIHYPTQRMNDGRLAFLAKDVQPLSFKTFKNVASGKKFKSNLKVTQQSVENEFFKIILDETTGAVKHLIDKRTGKDFVDTSQNLGLNQYLYLPGADVRDIRSTDKVTFQIKENGPLIISLVAESTAPGTHQLKQEIELINGLEKIGIVNTLNKERIRTKESVHFAYPVSVPDGNMHVDLGKAVLRPGVNQLPGSNKEFTGVQRWIDVSNEEYGITIAPQETPLIELGELVDEIERQKDPNEKHTWRPEVNKSNTFYFYVMNNYWVTNYKADQGGWITFNYTLFPHEKGFDENFSNEMGINETQPLFLSVQ